MGKNLGPLIPLEVGRDSVIFEKTDLAALARYSELLKIRKKEKERKKKERKEGRKKETLARFLQLWERSCRLFLELV